MVPDRLVGSVSLLHVFGALRENLVAQRATANHRQSPSTTIEVSFQRPGTARHGHTVGYVWLNIFGG